MSYSFRLADLAFLRSPAGCAALARARELPLREARLPSDVAAVRRLAGEFAPAVVETTTLRRRAVAKLDDSIDWLLTDEALQQATAGPVAAHRARRLRGHDVHDVTCSIGADLIAVATAAQRCVGSDIDEVRLAMARHNCASAGVAPMLIRADALRPTSAGTVVLADPARRDAGGRRRWHPDALVPSLTALAEVYRDRELVVKCAPGLDFDAVPWAAEIELVSLDGQVREATLWTRALATPGIRRRATVLRGGGSDTITDAEPDDCPVRPLGEWLIDPDGAVVRAGLVRHYAARHGLGQLDARIAYLTGDAVPPGVRGFRVIEYGRYTEKALRAAVRRHDIGVVEILVRGLAVEPDALRRRLRLSGRRSATVVLTRVGDTPIAVICHAQAG